ASRLAQGRADLDVHLDRQDLAGRQSVGIATGAGVPRGDLKTTQVLAGHPRPRRFSPSLPVRRGLVALVFVAAGSTSAPRGHEIPYYPSFYAQGIRVEFPEPSAPLRFFHKNAVHPFVGLL